MAMLQIVSITTSITLVSHNEGNTSFWMNHLSFFTFLTCKESTRSIVKFRKATVQQQKLDTFLFVMQNAKLLYYKGRIIMVRTNRYSHRSKCFEKLRFV